MKNTLRGFVVGVLSVVVGILGAACATVSPYAYDEAAECPAHMTSEGHESGVVRCRAMCSSYARDFADYTSDCKCWCAPASGSHRAAPTYTNPMTQM